MTQMMEVRDGKQVKDAQCFLQRIREDQNFMESVKRLNSAASFNQFIASNGFCLDEKDLVQAFIEDMEVWATYRDCCDCSFYEQGLLELL